MNTVNKITMLTNDDQNQVAFLLIYFMDIYFPIYSMMFYADIDIMWNNNYQVRNL